MALALHDESVSVVPEVVRNSTTHRYPPSLLPAVYRLTVVGAEGVAAAVVELRHVAALDLVDCPSRAVLVTEPSTSTAGADSNLVTVALQLRVPVRSPDPSKGREGFIQFALEKYSRLRSAPAPLSVLKP